MTVHEADLNTFLADTISGIVNDVLSDGLIKAVTNVSPGNPVILQINGRYVDSMIGSIEKINVKLEEAGFGRVRLGVKPNFIAVATRV